jgi:hypothetical protein
MDSRASMPGGQSVERRRARRQPLITQALLYRDNGEDGPQRVMLKDVSLLGMGFESPAPVEAGTRCRLCVEAGPMQMSVIVRVVCCQKMSGDTYRLGGEIIFNEPTDESQDCDSSQRGAD